MDLEISVEEIGSVELVSPPASAAVSAATTIRARATAAAGTTGDELNSHALAKLFYQTTACWDKTALETLERCEAAGNILARAFIMRLSVYGSGAGRKNRTRAEELSHSVLPWLREIVASFRSPSPVDAADPDADITVAEDVDLLDAEYPLDVYAQFLLGTAYAEGVGLGKDEVRAFECYRYSAKRRYPPAENNLGFCYDNGHGVSKDERQAVRWYRISAGHGNSVAQYNLGLCFKNAEGVECDFAQAVTWFRRSAEQNNLNALYSLGVSYLKRQGVERDYAKAMEFLRKAADQGDAASQNTLGNIFKTGQGVRANAVEAVRWYRKSAEQENPTAMYNLAMCYEDGQGVARDLVQAFHWYARSAEMHDADALCSLAQCYLEGRGVEVDVELALKHAQAAKEHGCSSALLSYVLGRAHCHERAPALQNRALAMNYLNEATRRNHDGALMAMAHLMHFHDHDTAGAIKLLRSAPISAQQSKMLLSFLLLKMAWKDTNAMEEAVELMEAAIAACSSSSSSGDGDDPPPSVYHSTTTPPVMSSAAPSTAPPATSAGTLSVLSSAAASSAPSPVVPSAYTPIVSASPATASAAAALRTSSVPPASGFSFSSSGAGLGELVGPPEFDDEAVPSDLVCNLALCYFLGVGTRQNLKKAFEYFLQASGLQQEVYSGGHLLCPTLPLVSDVPNARATYCLGWCFRYGEGVSKDLAKAVRCFRVSAEMGNAQAQLQLALCLQRGKGVSKDRDEAQLWLSRSADQGNVDAKTMLRMLQSPR